MIGTNLNLTLPLLSDTMAQMVAKTANALSAIEVSIADKATQAALNVTGSLTFNGNWANDVGGLILADGNAPSAPGSMYYHSGEFYLVDSTGTILVTANGQLNVASFGGIGGDYGGSNPALVYYDTASAQYRFYVNPSGPVWASVVAKTLVLEGPHALTIQPSASQTGDQTVTWLPSLPSSTLGLTMSAAGLMGTSAIYLGQQVFASSGPYNPSAGCTRAVVRMVGGGGGGGGVANGANYNASGGGASGLYTELLLTNITAGGSVVIGGGGAGGAGSLGGTGSTGAPGGDTTLTVSISGTPTTYTAGGGSGGAGTASAAIGVAAGGNSHNSSTFSGTIVCFDSGGTGHWTGSWGVAGKGGSSPLGNGGAEQASLFTGATSIAGNRADPRFGGGGGGAIAGNGGTLAAGGDGSGGYVIIDEYI